MSIFVLILVKMNRRQMKLLYLKLTKETRRVNAEVSIFKKKNDLIVVYVMR